MQQKRKLVRTILAVGLVVAALSYLFYPGTGQFSLMLNGEPVAEPLVRFAALPTAMLVMAVTGILIMLLFLGIGLFMFLFAVVLAMLGIFIMAPYFWPVLVIIVLVAALIAASNRS
ncbi:MAG: hypothetical protein ACXWF8_03070 [Methylobacter sp.]